MHGQVFNVYVSCIYTCCPSGILTLKTTFEWKEKKEKEGKLSEGVTDWVKEPEKGGITTMKNREK